jgi:hypothetical protein
MLRYGRRPTNRPNNPATRGPNKGLGEENRMTEKQQRIQKFKKERQQKLAACKFTEAEFLSKLIKYVQHSYNDDMTPINPYNLRVVEGKEVRIGEERE